MDFFKLKNRLLILLCISVLPFYFITFSYAYDIEDVSSSVIISPNILLSFSTNTIIDYNGYTSYFLPLEKGYTYTVVLNSNSNSIRTGYCDSMDVGSNIYNYNFTFNDITITINSDDYNYFYYCFGDTDPQVLSSYSITRTPNPSMKTSVNELVDNVGISQIWNIFDISVGYIVVVVLFVFGAYIIFRLIRRLTKGKSA